MKERHHKIHYALGRFDVGLCGLGGMISYIPNGMTCRICMFRYLAGQAPWAQGFLDELRGKVGRGQPATVIIPARTPEPMDGQVERAGYSQTPTLRYNGVPEETICKVLTVQPAWGRPIQPIMNDGWPAAKSVGVQPREVAEQPGDAGQVSYEPGRYYKAD